jgi:hypothetical protein
MDLQIKMGSSMSVVGPTNSGKTVFIIKLIEAGPEIFDIKPKKVFWCYGHETAAHDLMVKKNFNMIDCSDSLPEKFDFVTPDSIVVLDDLMLDTLTSKVVTQLYIRGAHHTPCFVISTQHNLFPGKQARNRYLNTQYHVLFANPADQGQIQHLARQMFPDRKASIEQAYRDVCTKPHGYLLLDNHPQTPLPFKVRTNILPMEKPMVVYVDKQNYRELALSKNLSL